MTKPFDEKNEKHDKRSIKVCILSSVHSAFDVRVFHKEARTLARAGYDVTLIAQHDQDEIVNGVKIIGLPRPRNRLHRITWLTLKVFWLALKQRADVYHFHPPELLPIGILLKLCTRKKVIYDVHEDWPNEIRTREWIPPVLRRIAARAFGSFERTCARFIDGIILAGDAVRNLSLAKATVIHNYPPLEYFKNLDKGIEKKRVERDNYILIFAGGLVGIRGIYEMIEAIEFASKHYRVKLRLLGKFVDTTTEARTRALQGFSQAELIGLVPYGDIPKYLSAADVGLILFHPLPNHVESRPNKLFEYMAAGLPVIASNFPLWKEIVEGNQCGLTVDPLNPREIAQTIEYLLNHPEERQRMGENGRKAVLEKYNWEREAEKLLALYQTLVAEARNL